MYQHKEVPQEEHTDLDKDYTHLPGNTEIPCVSVVNLKWKWNKSSYAFHRRVLRWAKAKSAEIKKFDLHRERNYANCSEEDILLQKAFHSLQPVALLLFVNDHKDYFFNTPKGKSAFATLEIGGCTYEGILEVGILPDNIIYHLMFNDQIKHKSEQLYQITKPNFEDIFEDSAENNEQYDQWCNKDGFTIEKQGHKYVITLDMPTSIASTTNTSRRTLYLHRNKFSSKFINFSN